MVPAVLIGSQTILTVTQIIGLNCDRLKWLIHHMVSLIHTVHNLDKW